MKKFFVIALGLVGLKATAQLVVEYRFEDMPAGTGTLNPYYVNYSLLTSASNFSAGAGLGGPVGYTLGASLTNPDKAYWGNNWTSTSAIDANDWFGFTITPLPGYFLGIDSLVFWERRSSTGPTTWQLRRNPFTVPIAAGATTLGNTSPQTPFGKHVIGPLPNFNAPISFRIYGTSSTGATGTLRIDTVRVYVHLIYILPIDLLSFDGNAEEGGIMLDWKTATETRNDYFTVYRSKDAIDWQEVGRISGAGDSQSAREYSLLDQNPKAGKNFYKLRQTDIDGAHEEFPIIEVDWEPPDKLVTFPNPSRANEAITVSGEVTSVLVNDGAGRFIESTISGQTIYFDGPPGVYYLIVVPKHGPLTRITVVRQ